jgi:hypothetical protein
MNDNFLLPYLNEDGNIKEKFVVSQSYTDGYEKAIEDMRFQVARLYRADRKSAIRRIIMYLYRDIDFYNITNWVEKSLWTKENLD